MTFSAPDTDTDTERSDSSFKSKSFPDSESFDFKSGVFTAPRNKKYLVTLTASLMKNSQIELQNFAQLFIMKNGELTSLDNYLLVEQGKVGNLNTEVVLEKGDTLSVYVGYHVLAKHVYSPSGTVRRYDGFNLDTVSLCIF